MNTTLYSLVAGIALTCAPVALKAQAGDLDLSFNGTGYVVNPVNTLDVTEKILVQDDQKVLMIGMSFDSTYTGRAYAFRYMPDGTPDTDFGTNGVFSYELDNEADIYSAVITHAGKILMVGATTDYLTYRLLLIQLNADGTLDDTFGTNGVVTQSVSAVVDNAEDMAYDVVIDGNNNILVCGKSYDENYVRRPVVVRFTSTGTLDTAFGVDGVATIPVLAVGSSGFKGLVLQPDGKIVAAGYFGNSELWYVLLLVRFNADGTLDTSFGDSGVVKFNYGNVDDEANDIQLASDGSIIVSGVTVTASYNYSALLAKFTPAGELDTTFGNAGTVKEDLASFDYSYNVALLSDGSIVMAGSSGVGPPSSFDQVVWKYNADGTPDATFGTNGYSQIVIPNYYTMIYGMDVQADGKILLGGQARTTTNQNYFYVARIQNDIGTGIPDVANSMKALLFPNPATKGSTVTLQVGEAVRPEAQVNLYAADGRLVFTAQGAQLRHEGQRINFQLPTDIVPGTYKVSAHQKGARFVSSLLVIN